MREGTIFVVTALLGAVASCSAGTTDHPSPPTSASYQIAFPSTAAAVGADTVQVFVYSRATPMTDCPSLITARSTMQGLPAAVAQTDQYSLCDGVSGAKGQIANVPYGDVSFLAVTQRAGKDYFTGCALATLSATSAPVEISLGAATTAHIQSTNCISVSQICATPPTCCVACDGGT
jgi:hypothetical protein